MSSSSDMDKHDPLLQRHLLGRLHHRNVQRLRHVLKVDDGAFEHLPVKPGNHLVRNRIVHPPQCPNYSIEPCRLHSGSEMEHLVRSRRVPHRRVTRRQGCKRKLETRVAFLDDAHQRERAVSHREPRLERLVDVLCTVTGEVDPAVVPECLNGALDGGRVPSDGPECHLREDVGLVPNPVDFTLYFG